MTLNVVLASDSALAQNAQVKNVTPTAASMNVSGPYKSGNLAVYLIHGADAAPGQKLITLNEALAQKKVVVHETGSVNELSVENKGDIAVFIQSGDIVKGGQQDRTLQYDLVLQPKSGKVPVASFCVEHGRWSQRGKEEKGYFGGGSNNMLASKGLKLAAKSATKSQSAVWDEVSKFQAKMSRKSQELAAPAVVAKPSPSSLQLTLESDGVKKLSEGYLKDLNGVTKSKNDTIGYAFAINGKINSVDIYPSHDLFQRLWPKLVASSAQEAAAENDAKTTHAPPAVTAVKKYIDESEKQGKETNESIANGSVKMKRRESDKNLYSESEGRLAGKQIWLHKNYLAK